MHKKRLARTAQPTTSGLTISVLSNEFAHYYQPSEIILHRRSMSNYLSKSESTYFYHIFLDIEDNLFIDEINNVNYYRYRNIFVSILSAFSSFLSFGVSTEKWIALCAKLRGLLQEMEVVAAEVCPAKLSDIKEISILVSGTTAAMSGEARADARSSQVSDSGAADEAARLPKKRGRPADPEGTKARLLKTYNDAFEEMRASSDDQARVLKAAGRVIISYERLRERGYAVGTLNAEPRLEAQRLLSGRKRARGLGS